MKTILEISSFYTCAKNYDHTRYSSWDMECDRHNFLSFWATFLHFWPTNNPENQNFEKMKHASGDIIILHLCTKNQNHMYFFCHFGLFFALSSHYWHRKLKCGKNVKKLEILPIYTCTKNEDHMINGSWNIRADGLSFLPFWAIFCPVTLLTTQKIQILKKWKNS